MRIQVENGWYKGIWWECFTRIRLTNLTTNQSGCGAENGVYHPRVVDTTYLESFDDKSYPSDLQNLWDFPHVILFLLWVILSRKKSPFAWVGR